MAARHGAGLQGLVRTPEDKRDRAVIDASMQRANARALILERALQGREFIAGRQLSMGDIALVASAHRWLGLPAERPRRRPCRPGTAAS